MNLKAIYGLLEIPIVYNAAQYLLGGEKVYSILKMNIRKILDGAKYDRSLDVGCGTGAFRDCLPGSYYGLDINENYIEEMQRNGIENVMVGDATALPYEDRFFDVVFSIGVLHHLPEELRKKMLTEIFRVCKNDGCFLLIDGIIPTDKKNIIGYVLAKLDRGKYKMRIEDFKTMFDIYSNERITISYKHCKIFPHEYVIVIGRKK